MTRRSLFVGGLVNAALALAMLGASVALNHWTLAGVNVANWLASILVAWMNRPLR